MTFDSKCIKMGVQMEYVFLGKFSNRDFKRNILDGTLMQHNKCKNFAQKSVSSEKYPYHKLGLSELEVQSQTKNLY